MASITLTETSIIAHDETGIRTVKALKKITKNVKLEPLEAIAAAVESNPKLVEQALNWI